MAVLDAGTNSNTHNAAGRETQREDLTPEIVHVLETEKGFRSLSQAAEKSTIKEERVNLSEEIQLNQLINQNIQNIDQSNLSSQVKEVLKSAVKNEYKDNERNSFFNSLKQGLTAEQQLSINESINRLLTEKEVGVESSHSSEAIRNSVLESIAGGAYNFKQGTHATCTMSSEYVYNFVKDPSYAVKLLTELALDGETMTKSGEILKATNSLELEQSTARTNAATLAETLWRDSLMEKALQLASKDGLTFQYDKTTGTAYAYIDGQLVNKFQGLHPEHWTAMQEMISGAPVNFQGTQNDGFRYSASELSETILRNNDILRCELNWAQTGAHSRHYVNAVGIFTDQDGVERVKLANTQDPTELRKICASHRAEADGTQSISLADFNQRLLSVGVDDATRPSFVKNNFGHRDYRTQLENARQQPGYSPEDVYEIQMSEQDDAAMRAKKANEEMLYAVRPAVTQESSEGVQVILTTSETQEKGRSDAGAEVAQERPTLRKKQKGLLAANDDDVFA